MKRSLTSSVGSGRRGSALLIALFTLITVAAVGAMYLQITSATMRRQTAEVQTTRAFYLAEAGLAESFQALRIGRTGQVGSEAAPAVFGNGLLWVDAIETVDSQVRLTSTALVGQGRSSLSLVVEPVEIPLGFFSDEDLVVDEVLLVDGFNSEEATYEEEVGGGGDELQDYGQWLVNAMGMELLVGFLDVGGALTKQKVANSSNLTSSEAEEFVARLTELRRAYQAGTLFPRRLFDRGQRLEQSQFDHHDVVRLRDAHGLGRHARVQRGRGLHAALRRPGRDLRRRDSGPAWRC